MNAKTLKKLRRAAQLVHQRMLGDKLTDQLYREGVISPPPTPRQVYRRLKAQEALHERPR